MPKDFSVSQTNWTRTNSEKTVHLFSIIFEKSWPDTVQPAAQAGDADAVLKHVLTWSSFEQFFRIVCELQHLQTFYSYHEQLVGVVS